MCYWHAASFYKLPASTTVNIQHIGPRLYHSNMNCFCLFIINTHTYSTVFSTTMWYLNCGATQPQFTKKNNQSTQGPVTLHQTDWLLWKWWFSTAYQAKLHLGRQSLTPVFLQLTVSIFITTGSSYWSTGSLGCCTFVVGDYSSKSKTKAEKKKSSEEHVLRFVTLKKMILGTIFYSICIYLILFK